MPDEVGETGLLFCSRVGPRMIGFARVARKADRTEISRPGRCSASNRREQARAFVRSCLLVDWSDLQIRVQIAYRANLLEKGSDVKNCRLGLPATNDLYSDRHSFLACAEPHRNGGQAGNI